MGGKQSTIEQKTYNSITKIASLGTQTSLLSQEQEEIKNKINELFISLTFTKIKNQVLQNKYFSIYCARISCMLCIQKQYIFVAVPIDEYEIGYINSIVNLDWTSIQTRTIKNVDFDVRLAEQSYDIIHNEILDDVIDSVSRDKNETQYMSRKYNINIKLLHDKNTSINEFADSTTVLSALNSFNCILTI